MKYLFEHSINISHLDSYYAMSCFYRKNATLIYGSAADGIAGNKTLCIGGLTNEFYEDQLVLVFFLLRHAMELGVKASLEYEINKIEADFDKLDDVQLKKLDTIIETILQAQNSKQRKNFEKCIKEKGKIIALKSVINEHDLKLLLNSLKAVILSDDLNQSINITQKILSEYGLLNDAQIIRYHIDKGGKKLNTLPCITTPKIESLLEAVGAVLSIFTELQEKGQVLNQGISNEQ